MFCSNCGKTVGAEDRQCPHCHIGLGDVRFPGMPYTSVQFRIVPGTPMPIDEAYSYTRKDYSVSIETNEDGDPLTESVEGEDVENATTYRPVLQREDEDEEAFDGEYADEEYAEEAPAGEPVDVDPDNMTEEQIADALRKLQKKGLDTEGLMAGHDEAYDEEAEVPDADLDERLQQYERAAQEDEERRSSKGLRGKLRFPFGGQKAYQGVDDADEAYEEQSEEVAEEGYEEAPEYDEAEPVYEETAEYAEEADIEAEPAYEVPAEDAPAADAETYDEPAAEDAPEGVYEGELPDDGEAYEEQPAPEEGAEDYPDYEQYGEYGSDDVAEAPAMSLREWMDKPVLGIRLASILKVAGGLVVFAICLVLGLKWFGYVSEAQQKSPIDGVTLSLYESGIEQIAQNATTEKTTALLAAYGKSVLEFTALQQQYTDSLKALMPAEPGVNDQLFMDTLVHIQENIANAVIADAMSGDASSEESRQNWQKIESSIATLKEAKDSVQLQAIGNEKVEVITTTPTPAATPVSYKVLTRGDEGEDVMKLQQRLFDLGYLADAADGKFGNKTTTAIKYFQMGHELNVTGIADSATQAKLFADDALDMDAAKAAYQQRQAEAGN